MKELAEGTIYRDQYLESLCEITKHPYRYEMFQVRPLHSCFKFSQPPQPIDKLVKAIQKFDYPMLSLATCYSIFKKTYGEAEFFMLDGTPAYTLRYWYRRNHKETEK